MQHLKTSASKFKGFYILSMKQELDAAALLDNSYMHLEPVNCWSEIRCRCAYYGNCYVLLYLRPKRRYEMAISKQKITL